MRPFGITTWSWVALWLYYLVAEGVWGRSIGKLIFGLRVFEQVIALTNGGPVDASETLATQVYKQTFAIGKFGYGAALALILTALVAVLAFAQLVVLRAREARM
jgi:ABC-type sugar transport system permease subunit